MKSDLSLMFLHQRGHEDSQQPSVLLIACWAWSEWFMWFLAAPDPVTLLKQGIGGSLAFGGKGARAISMANGRVFFSSYSFCLWTRRLPL